MSKKLWITPAGEALYPHLQTPDTKYEKTGLYQVKLILKESDYNAFKNRFDEYFNIELEKVKDKHESVAIAKKTPFQESEEGLTVYAKQNAVRHTAKGVINFDVKAYDSTGRIIAMPNVGGGSIIKLALEPNAYFVSGEFGVNFRLRSVQIIELVEYGTNDALFDEVEGGFTGESFDSEFQNAEKAQSKEDGDFSF